MGTRDVINTTQVVGGIEFVNREREKAEMEGHVQEVQVEEEVDQVQKEKEKEETETEEQKALRELLAGERVDPPREQVELILPASASGGGDDRSPPIEEGDSFRRDLMSRPDEVTSFPPSLSLENCF